MTQLGPIGQAAWKIAVKQSSCSNLERDFVRKSSGHRLSVPPQQDWSLNGIRLFLELKPEALLWYYSWFQKSHILRQIIGLRICLSESGILKPCLSILECRWVQSIRAHVHVLGIVTSCLSGSILPPCLRPRLLSCMQSVPSYWYLYVHRASMCMQCVGLRWYHSGERPTSCLSAPCVVNL